MSDSELALVLAQQASKSFLESSFAPIVVTAVVTLAGAWLTFRGKTQDTANWLIVALRTDAEEARDDAREARTAAEEARKAASAALARSQECEAHRAGDQQVIAEMKRRLDKLEDVTSTE